MIEPLIVEIETRLTPFEIYRHFSSHQESALLESSMFHERYGQYSFIGWSPFLSFRSYEGDPFEALKELIKKYSVNNETEFPFVGGGIGYFSYDLVRDLVKLPRLNEEQLNVPTCAFNFYETILIVDELKKKTYISALGFCEAKEHAIEKVKDLLSSLEATTKHPRKEEEALEFRSPFTKETYIETVEKMRQYIRNGDVYIANLTQTFVTSTKQNPLDTYQVLRSINPAPFSGMLNFNDFTLISSSPERFLKIKDGHVETRPIKGTRPRGKTPEEDERNKDELIHSEKDQSELLMIIDLERNDLSQVCKPHSVKVKGLFTLETYATVYHLVGTVEGELMENISGIDCIKACFPGGSITGAPKLRAMEIIEELEPTRRNIYTGCMGYLGFDGNVDLNIVIRSIVMKDGRAYMGVGGGITWESECEAEFQETLDKAKALFRSLEGRL